MKNIIPLFRVAMSPDVDEELLKVLHSGYIGQGPKVDEFEAKLAEKFNNPNVVTLSSGTHGLTLALRLAGVGPGTSVLCSSLSCAASVQPIVNCGAEVIWCDIGKDINVTIESVKESIKENTKAAIFVHWGGYPFDLEPIYNILKENNIKLIEDAAHCYTSIYKDSIIGDNKYSDYCMISLQAIKFLTASDGGVLFTKSREDYKKAKLMRWFGIDRENTLKDMRCLHRNTLLKLPNGHTIKAVDAYKNKIPYLLSVNEDGYIFKNRVKNWFKNKINDRYYIKLVTKGSNPYKIVVTNDHKILTPSGYIKAEDLNIGDVVVSSYPGLTKKQKSVVIGSILGDAAFTKKNKHKGHTKETLIESHSSTQKDYVLLKAKILDSLGINVTERGPNHYYKTPNGRIQFSTKRIPIIGRYRSLFYNDKEKIIPKNFLKENWDELLFAVWFMDDGCTKVRNSVEGIIPMCEIASMSFNKHDLNWLSDFLNEKGYINRVNKIGRILFNKEGSIKLINDISPYVPKSMRYKVAHIKNNFNEEFWKNEYCLADYDEIIIKEKIKNNYKNYSSVYCFEMEKYDNFCTNNIVVHNCVNDIKFSGDKWHMTDLNAIIGLNNLKLAEQNVKISQDNAAYYNRELQNIDGIEITQNAIGRVSSFWLYTVLIKDRTSFASMMGEKGIHVSRVHERLDKYTFTKKFIKDLPGLDSIYNKYIAIPCGWWVSKSDREYIVDSIKKGW